MRGARHAGSQQRKPVVEPWRPGRRLLVAGSAVVRRCSSGGSGSADGRRLTAEPTGVRASDGRGTANGPTTHCVIGIRAEVSLGSVYRKVARIGRFWRTTWPCIRSLQPQPQALARGQRSALRAASLNDSRALALSEKMTPPIYEWHVLATV